MVQKLEFDHPVNQNTTLNLGENVHFKGKLIKNVSQLSIVHHSNDPRMVSMAHQTSLKLNLRSSASDTNINQLAAKTQLVPE